MFTTDELRELIAQLTEKRHQLLIALGETNGMIVAYEQVLKRLAPRNSEEVYIGEEVRP